MIALTALLAAADIFLLMAVWLVLRGGIRFRSISLRFISRLSVAVFLLSLLFAFTAPHLAFAVLMALGAGCLCFLLGCAGAWLSDRQLAFVERRFERPEVREAVEKNAILRTVWRLGQGQRKE